MEPGGVIAAAEASALKEAFRAARTNGHFLKQRSPEESNGSIPPVAYDPRRNRARLFPSSFGYREVERVRSGSGNRLRSEFPSSRLSKRRSASF
jgi:hypothetical protein